MIEFKPEMVKDTPQNIQACEPLGPSLVSCLSLDQHTAMQSKALA